MSVSTQASEIFLVWQHLVNAELINGLFSGAPGPASSTTASQINNNIPASKLDGGGWTLKYFYYPTGDTSYFGRAYNHVMLFGFDTTSNYSSGDLLTPQEASEIDSKIDDGFPQLGSIITPGKTTEINCTGTAPASPLYGTSTADPSLGFTYNISYGNRACSLIFITGF